MDLAGQNLIWQILGLTSSPTFAKNVLVVDNYGCGSKNEAGEAYKRYIFSNLSALRSYGVNIGFVDLSTLWNAVLGSEPGYKAFGYTSSGACLTNSTTMEGACKDPGHSFGWLPG
jgi:hypothetical protein